jgi:hypothetical protein
VREEGTRRVQLVREGGGRGGARAPARLPVAALRMSVPAAHAAWVLGLDRTAWCMSADGKLHIHWEPSQRHRAMHSMLLALTFAGMARLTQEHANNANSEMVFDEFLDFFTRISRLKAVAKARARRPSGVFNSIPAVKQFLDL